MGDKSAIHNVTVLSFGPIAETLGKIRSISLNETKNCRQIIVELGLENWLDNGLKVAINGEMVNLDSIVSPGDELAILPPVSGG